MALKHGCIFALAFTSLCAQTTQTLVLRSSQPVQASDLTLTVGGQPRTILALDPHTRVSALPVPLDLPPGTFTDIVSLAPGGTLNILLLDALNTPARSPAYLRSQLQKLAANTDPATPLAIFGLADHVILLQGFSGPRPLRDAAEHRLIPRAPANVGNDGASPPEALLAANLQMFLAQAASVDAQFHPQRTLDALHILARYLATLPGHKNLLWLSASFPEGLYADPSKPTALNAEELYDTHALLAFANVSLYPIDTHRLLPANSTKLLLQPGQPAQPAIMTQLAESTGGEAFFDTTDLAATVSAAIQAGSHYYTLTYEPVNPPTPGTSQPVHIVATTAAAVDLAYPRSAYAEPGDASDAYAIAAMARGAPTPAGVLFKVRVLPASSATESTVAPGNIANPDYRVPGPFQRYALDFAALPAQIALSAQPDGRHTGKVEFLACVYDVNGRLLNSEGKSVAIDLSPAQYQHFQGSSLSLHLELSVPVRQESYLRLAVHDTANKRFGVVELPASPVSHLAPAPTPQR